MFYEHLDADLHVRPYSDIMGSSSDLYYRNGFYKLTGL